MYNMCKWSLFFFNLFPSAFFLPPSSFLGIDLHYHNWDPENQVDTSWRKGFTGGQGAFYVDEDASKQ